METNTKCWTIILKRESSVLITFFKRVCFSFRDANICKYSNVDSGALNHARVAWARGRGSEPEAGQGPKGSAYFCIHVVFSTIKCFIKIGGLNMLLRRSARAVWQAGTGVPSTSLLQFVIVNYLIL